MSYYNYQNFNMMNNGWGGILQQGLGMFCGNSYGMMSMGGSIFGCGNNFFTNCYGEPNYDAIAGFGVANALTGVLGQAISTHRAQKAEAKQAEVDAEARLEEVNTIIKEKEACIKTAEEEKGEYSAKITDLNNEIAKLEQSKKDIDGLEDAWKEAYNIDPNSPDTKLAKKAYDDAVEANKVIDAEIKAQEKAIKDINENKIPSCDEKIKDLKADIEELKEEKAKLEKQVTNTKLAKAQGKKHQATKPEKFNAKWENDKAKAGAEFEAGDMRYAIGKFANAVDSNDKKAWAAKINTIYTYLNNNDRMSITSHFKFAATEAKKYLD